ncbi:MAG TPA: glycoside hydrolase family 2 TIM barrel-domain containing protein, partial [Solirubrobacterales bacterium]|nr:glycoside hydrolase family 2 TIM barrel-domain containing protein [Solirubrobacterales bacterium]
MFVTAFAWAPGAAAATAPTPGAPYFNGPANRYTLGGVWFLKTDPGNQGQRSHFERTKDFSSWQPTTAPNAFNAGDFSEASYTGGIAWYGYEFTKPSGPRGTHWVLRFDSVHHKAQVFLNGRRIGGHTGGYVPFEVDAASIRSGVNRLVVRVDNRLTDYTVPSQETRNDQLTGGWWNYGGILRDVILRRAKSVDVVDVATRSNFKSTRGPAKVTVLATIRNVSGRKQRVRVSGRFGRVPVRFRPLRMRKNGRATVQATVTIRRPKLWGPTSPSLYNVSVSAAGRGGGSSYRLRAGIRKLAVSSSGMLSLNRKRVRLRGVSYHEADEKIGAAWTPTVRDANLALIDKLGAKMIRSHYPLSPSTMEWADRSGILVWSQAPVFRARETQLKNKRYRANAVQYVREMVVANRAHPSVLVWSLMNEPVPAGTLYLNRLVTAAKSAAKQLDPGGLVGADYAGAPLDEFQHPAYRKLDVLGINEYFGWYPGLNGSTLELSELGPYLDYLRSAYAHQA